MRLGCVLGAKFSQKPIKNLWCVVRTSWERLESVWRRLGASWDRLESVLEHLDASWAVLETSSERLGNVLERRSVPILIRKKAQNQTNIFWPKNVGLKKRQAQNQTNIFWPKNVGLKKRQFFTKTYKKPRFFNDFWWLSIREVWEGGQRQGEMPVVWEGGQRQGEMPVGRRISTLLIGGRVL